MAEHEITRAELLDLLKKEEQEGFVALTHQLLALFLEGLISYKRGKLETPATPIEPVSFLTNNDILKKIRVALELRRGYADT